MAYSDSNDGASRRTPPCGAPPAPSANQRAEELQFYFNFDEAGCSPPVPPHGEVVCGTHDATNGDLDDRLDFPLCSLLDSLAAFLRRYIVFSEEGQPRVLALWVAHTWVKHAFDYTPYVHVISPVRRCGKSRLLECLDLLCDTPRMQILPTPATLLRVIESECPTLLIDEVDTLFVKGSDSGKESLRGILNAGFHVNGRIPRCVGKEHEVKYFSVFCPKVLSGIGSIPDTIADRCIPLQLARRIPTQGIEMFRRREAQVEADALKRALEFWRETSGVMEGLRSARPEIRGDFSDRQVDIIEPLVAISDMAGDTWPVRSRADLTKLCRSKVASDESLSVRLLCDLRAVFAGRMTLQTTEAIASLVQLETTAPWADLFGRKSAGGTGLAAASMLARLLKPFDIGPTTIRFQSGTAKGYRRQDFSDAWARYCPIGHDTPIEA